MKTRPILFSGPMVQAIMEGRKTQTRRIIKPQPDSRGLRTTNVPYENWHGNEVKPAFQVGDVMWVRETWQYSDDLEEPYWYRQKYEHEHHPDYHKRMKWKPSIFMPKEACRIFLKVTDVRVERLRDISEEDAEEEGIDIGASWNGNDYSYYPRDYSVKYDNHGESDAFPYLKEGEFVESFKTLWESINGKDSWKRDPWVWVYTFDRVERPDNFLKPKQ